MAITPNSIITPQTPKTATAVCATANTTYGNTPTNTAVLVNAASQAVRVVRITAIPRATVTATQLQLFLSKDNGVTMRLIDSALMPAYTMAATTAAPKTDFGYSDDNPMLLQAGDTLYAAIGVTGDIAFRAEMAEY